MFTQIVICILIIIILHQFWNYMKDTFTYKKKKTINADIEKYKKLLEEQTEYNNIEPLEQDLEQFMQEIILQNNI
jgi:DNA-binding transcriptional regulator GbsR (MarR family)